MAQSKHYCATCETHYGGPPNNITPKEHADIAHDGKLFFGIKNGTWKDWKNQKSFKYLHK